MTPTSTHPEAAHCPMQAATPRALLAPQDQLVLPLHRRVVAQYATDEVGATELRLYCGEQEVSFDEPAFFAFGESLAQQSRFTAGSATAWGPGYDWAQVQPLLNELLQAGVLRLASEVPQAALVTGPRPAPLPAGPCTEPRSWSEGADLMQALTGRPLELAYLELVLPIFRIAHIALDACGRQVGEANVFPKALRLDVPTQWRACIYAGTRHQVERPMNVTALKAMRQHWGAMTTLLAAVRTAYLQRFPAAQAGWTVGHVERLATCVLGLPTYLLMRTQNPVANGALHPALSSLFRVTDGLRMVMHQMLFVPIAEPTSRPDAPVSSAQILAYAERNYSFHSEHGVCAGPQALIEEFLAVLLDGQAAAAQCLDPAVQAALDDIEPAIDYALLGLQAHAVVFTLWPLMAHSYERLAAVAADWAHVGGAAVQALAQRLAGHVQNLQRNSYLATEAWRSERIAVYADMHAQCHAGLASRGLAGDDEALGEQIAPMLTCTHARVDRQLEDLLQARLGRADGSDRHHVRTLRDSLMTFALQTQAVLRVAGDAQSRLNRHLGRRAPQRAFNAADLNLHNRLQGQLPSRLPYLIDEIEAALQLRLAIDADSIQVTDLEPEAPALASLQPHTTGMVPDVARVLSTQTQ